MLLLCTDGRTGASQVCDHVCNNKSEVPVRNSTPRREDVLWPTGIAPCVQMHGTRHEWSPYPPTIKPWFPLDGKVVGPQSRTLCSGTVSACPES